MLASTPPSTAYLDDGWPVSAPPAQLANPAMSSAGGVSASETGTKTGSNANGNDAVARAASASARAVRSASSAYCEAVSRSDPNVNLKVASWTRWVRSCPRSSTVTSGDPVRSVVVMVRSTAVGLPVASVRRSKGTARDRMARRSSGKK